MKLQGQTAIVTGGGSGLGAATAELLAKNGVNVAILDRNTQAAQAVANKISGLAFECDITNSESVESAIAATIQRFGPIRILMNVAGIGGARRVVSKEGLPMPLADFEKTIQVNLVGTFNVIRLVAAHMTKLQAQEDDERGVIINTASVAAYDGQVGQAAYAASKGGLVALTLPLARDLGQFGIRVCTIAPGLFLTPLLSELPQEVQHSLAASIPFPRRLGLASEFAELATHIVTNLSLNGEVIRLDGALRLSAR